MKIPFLWIVSDRAVLAETTVLVWATTGHRARLEGASLLMLPLAHAVVKQATLGDLWRRWRP